MKKTLLTLVAAGAAAVLTTTPAQAGPHRPARAGTGTITVIQAVPGATTTVSIDGKVSKTGAEVGTQVGVNLSPGSHELTFSDVMGKTIKTTVNVKAGSNSDVVLHRPAAVNGAPVVNTYKTPTGPIGPAKARLLLAHTATVAPADVKFDGKVVFTDIANGEFAEADVPAGGHRVALLPSGVKANPILGPLDVKLAARTATMVYAVGNPKTRSMNVIVHTVRLAPDGSSAPDTIKTGSAGLAAGVAVTPFSPTSSRSSASQGPSTLLIGGYAAGALALAGLVAARRRRPVRTPAHVAVGTGRARVR